MSQPSLFSTLSPSFSFGDTPPVNLLQDLTPEEDADVLMLGCGDPRSILFTVHSALAAESYHWDNGLARNILFLTLLADDELGTQTDSIWGFFYHLFIDDETRNLLIDQCHKLLNAGSTCLEWNRSMYGAYIRFCDLATLVTVRRFWEQYVKTATLPGAEARALKKSYAEAIRQRSLKVNDPIPTSLRSAAGLFCYKLESVEEYGGLEHYWKAGIPFDDPKMMQMSTFPNPTFVQPNERIRLYRGSDPVQGYPLQILWVSQDPLACNDKTDMMRFETMAYRARQLLHLWGYALRTVLGGQVSGGRRKKVGKRTGGRLVVRYACADALAFCRGLEYCRRRGGEVETPFYAGVSSFRPLVLNGGDYDEKTDATSKAPMLFNVIDTSSLVDSLGWLNVLIVTTPLLHKGTPSSTLYTETTQCCNEGRPLAHFEELLRGDVVTMSVLLGITPVAYVSGFASTSNLHEISVVPEVVCSKPESKKFLFRDRIAWKRIGEDGAMRVDPRQMVKFLKEVDKSMYPYQLLEEAGGCHTVALRIDLAAPPKYHRKSLVILLMLVRERFREDWEAILAELLAGLPDRPTSRLIMSVKEETLVHLFVNGLCESSPFPPVQTWMKNLPGRLRAWKKVPDVVCLTFIIPYDTAKRLFAMQSMMFEESGVTLELHICGKGNVASFGDLQYAFGNASLRGVLDDAFVGVEESEDAGTPLIVSGMVPTVLLGGADRSFEVRVKQTMRVIFTTKNESDVILLKAVIYDTARVFITRERPQLRDEFTKLRAALSPLLPTAATTSQSKSRYRIRETSVVLEDIGERLASFEIVVEGVGKAFAGELLGGGKVEVVQTSPCWLVVAVGGLGGVEVGFPFPVDGTRCIVGVARKSAYIKISVPPYVPSRCGNRGFSKQVFHLPITSKGTLATWNLHRIPIDSLPLTDLILMTNAIKELLSMQHSERQQALMSMSTPSEYDAIIGLKEFVSTLMLRFIKSGELKRHVTFGVHGEDGKVHTVIVANFLRIDPAASAPVLDACVLHFTPEVRLSLGSDESTVPVDHRIPFLAGGGDRDAIWEAFLTASIERCRTWSHHPVKCEHLRRPKRSARSFCSCGIGKTTKEFVKSIYWRRYANNAIRAAFSPLFVPSFVEPFSDALLRIVRRNTALAAHPEMRGSEGPSVLFLMSAMRRAAVPDADYVEFRLNLYDEDSEWDVRRRLFWNGVRDDSVEAYVREWRARKEGLKQWHGGDGSREDPFFIEVAVML
ncbi:hypothetical protein HDU67_001822 [Dinochytrium kinnereticum]|nr:hypothetical protein HDU67_001822 [Dinochytrium kinnereticum]